MIRIIDAEPYYTDACSFYRGRMPLSILSKQNDIQIIHGGDIHGKDRLNWHTLALGDILFFSRPYGAEALDIILKAKNIGLSVWADYDDNLFDLPETNKVNCFFHEAETLKEILSLMDIITVTSGDLKQRYSEFNENIIIIPNCFNDLFFPLDKKAT